MAATGTIAFNGMAESSTEPKQAITANQETLSQQTVSKPTFALLLKNGQRMPYDDLTLEGSTYIVRSGTTSTFVDKADVARILDGKIAARPTSATTAPAHARQWIETKSSKYNLRAELIQAVMEVESAYKVNARSNKGAIGLMQLMPGTARGLRVNAHDPEQNVEGGAKLLDQLITRYENRKNGLVLAIAAYNAGPGAVDAYRGVPPYKETRDYVRKVMQRYRKLAKGKS